MKLKILYLVLFILIFIPIGLCEKINNIENINNTKIYNENDKIISIYSKNIDKSMDIKLISTISDIDKLIKIIEVTNYIEYIPDKKNDFITKTKRVYGNDIYKIEYFIEKYSYTFENIVINKTIFNNKTGKNEIKIINKTIIKDINPFWVEFNFYNRTISKNETFKLKIVHYKKPELGFFKIQTIPIFKNIECKEFTWWLGNWNLRRPILINNTYGDNVTDYTLKSINLSIYQINASSSRIINETSGLQENFWNESIDSDGNLEYVWCNFSKVNNGSWINETYYIYYQSEPYANSVSNGKTTFLLFDDFENYNDTTEMINIWSVDYGNPTLETSIVYEGSQGINLSILSWVKQNLSVISNFEIVIYGYYNSMTDSYGLVIKESDADTIINMFGGYPTAGKWGYRIDVNSGSTNTGINQAGINTWQKMTLRLCDSKISFWENNILIIDKISYTRIPHKIYLGRDSTYHDLIYIRKYIDNEPKLWTVGDIEYPEGYNMTCNLEIITHLTEKQIKIVNMTGDIVNINKTNECINLSYDSYIIYMSNPVEISSFTELLNTIDNVFIQFFLFAFLIVVGIIFFTFLQIIKNRGFKGVTK